MNYKLSINKCHVFSLLITISHLFLPPQTYVYVHTHTADPCMSVPEYIDCYAHCKISMLCLLCANSLPGVVNRVKFYAFHLLLNSTLRKLVAVFFSGVCLSSISQQCYIQRYERSYTNWLINQFNVIARNHLWKDCAFFLSFDSS